MKSVLAALSCVSISTVALAADMSAARNAQLWLRVRRVRFDGE